MLPRIIRQQLSSLRRRERLLRLIWGVARLLTVILVLVVLACLTDYLIERFQDTPFSVHLLLLIVLGVGTVLAGVLFFWAVGNRLSDDELSLWVEDKTPTLQHRLISAVQFNEEGAAFPGMSRELVGVVTKEAEQHVRKVPVARVADHSRLHLSALIFLPALVLVVLPPLIWPSVWETYDALLARLFLSERELPRRVKVWNATAEIHPRGEKLIVKVKASGSLPTDSARVVFNMNGIRDRKDLTVSRETLPVKLDLLAAKTAELRGKIDNVRAAIANERGKNSKAKARMEELTELLKKTDDAKREALDLEFTAADKEARAALEQIDRLGNELKKGLYLSQDELREEIEAHRLELDNFLKERPNDNVKAAMKEMDLALKDLDRDNQSATLASAHKHLVAAQASLAGSAIRLIEGDVLLLQLPVSDGDSTWVVARKDDLLQPDGEPVTRVHVQGADTWTQRFTTGTHGKATLELSYQKKEAGEAGKPLTLTLDVAAKEFTYYQTEVQAAGDTLKFRAYVGDGRTKEEETLRFEPRPVADVTAYTILPSYCQVKPDGERHEIKQYQGEAMGIKGSAIRVEAKILNKVTLAMLHLYETESREQEVDDPWKKRERKVKSIEMGLFLKDDELKLVFDAPFFFRADGKLLMEGVEHEDIKEGALVNFEATPSGGLIQMRLIGPDSAAIPGVDGSHRGTITQVDKIKRTMKVNRTHGPTLAEARFDLDPKISAYSVEVIDANDFKNDPIPRMAVKQFAEPAPTVNLLREEISSQKWYKKLSAVSGDKKGDKGVSPLSGKDLSGIFEGMPVPVGGKIPISYKFNSPLGVGEAKLKFRILKKRLSGNENQISDGLGLALDDAEGAAKVREVLAGGTADKAGMKPGDMITHVGPTKVFDVDSFLKAVRQFNPGDELTLKFKRDDLELQRKVQVGARVDEKFKTLNLKEIIDDGSKGEFEVERGRFKDSMESDTIQFFAVPKTAPVPYRFGGGFFMLATEKLGGGNGPQQGDQLEFFIEVYPAIPIEYRYGKNRGAQLEFIEVYPASNPDAKVLRPIGRSETRTKYFSTREELFARILASYDEYGLVRGVEVRQEEVFDDPSAPNPKNEGKKKKAE